MNTAFDQALHEGVVMAGFDKGLRLGPFEEVQKIMDRTCPSIEVPREETKFGVVYDDPLPRVWDKTQSETTGLKLGEVKYRMSIFSKTIRWNALDEIYSQFKQVNLYELATQYGQHMKMIPFYCTAYLFTSTSANRFYTYVPKAYDSKNLFSDQARDGADGASAGQHQGNTGSDFVLSAWSTPGILDMVEDIENKFPAIAVSESDLGFHDITYTSGAKKILFVPPEKLGTVKRALKTKFSGDGETSASTQDNTWKEEYEVISLFTLRGEDAVIVQLYSKAVPQHTPAVHLTPSFTNAYRSKYWNEENSDEADRDLERWIRFRAWGNVVPRFWQVVLRYDLTGD